MVILVGKNLGLSRAVVVEIPMLPAGVPPRIQRPHEKDVGDSHANITNTGAEEEDGDLTESNN